MSDTTTLNDVTEEVIKSWKQAKEAEKAGAPIEEQKAIFDKNLADTPHRANPQKANEEIHTFLASLYVKQFGPNPKIDEVFGNKVKDLGEASDGGGYLTPLEFSGFLVELMYKLPVIRPYATKIPMTSDQMQVPVESATVAANWTAELATVTQSDPDFGEVILAVNNLIGISRMSRQLLLDAAINYNLTDWIMMRFAKAIGRAEDTAFMVGSGTGQAKGIRQYTFNHTKQQNAGTLSGDDLINCYHNLPYQYRTQGNPVWLINDATLGTIRKLKDSNNQYLYTDGYGQAFVTPGGTPLLMGFPVLVQNDIPVNLGSGNASEIYFGDLSYYLIGDRESIFSEISTQEGTSFAQHRAAVKVGERIDGQLASTDGISQLTGVTTT
jgi:HK97 family phage major capsid protein